jgi:hypothetical protein
MCGGFAGLTVVRGAPDPIGEAVTGDMPRGGAHGAGGDGTAIDRAASSLVAKTLHRSGDHGRAKPGRGPALEYLARIENIVRIEQVLDLAHEIERDRVLHVR